MSAEFKNICPVCANDAGNEVRYKEQANIVERTVKCSRCKTVWVERYVPSGSRNIVFWGEPQEDNPKSIPEAVEEMLRWAHQDAFVRFDEPPRLSCDEILDELDRHARDILTCSKKDSPA